MLCNASIMTEERVWAVEMEQKPLFQRVDPTLIHSLTSKCDKLRLKSCTAELEGFQQTLSNHKGIPHTARNI